MLNIIKITKNFHDALIEDSWVKVHSVFQNLINVETCKGLFTIQNELIGFTPLSGVVSGKISFNPLIYTPGSMFQIKNMKAEIVSPILNTKIHFIAMDFIFNELQFLMEVQLQSYTLKSINKMGFSNLISQYKSLDLYTNKNQIYHAPLHLMLIQILNDFIDDYNKREEPNFNFFIKFIGLGNGLTPSGDDFLVGLLSVLHFFNFTAYELQIKLIINQNKEKTTPISESFLRESLEDNYSEIINSFYKSIENKSLISLKQNVETILNYGHSSGMDIISGILFGIYFIQNKKIKIKV